MAYDLTFFSMVDNPDLQGSRIEIGSYEGLVLIHMQVSVHHMSRLAYMVGILSEKVQVWFEKELGYFSICLLPPLSNLLPTESVSLSTEPVHLLSYGKQKKRPFIFNFITYNSWKL